VGYDLGPELGKRTHAQCDNDCLARRNGGNKPGRPCQQVDLHKHTVRLYWKRSDGTPYAYLSALTRSSEGGVGRLLFATNAGMFDPALKPVGLYVEQGRELVHVNPVRLWQFSHEAEWDLLCIRR
jgi:uncharacterized protein YigE (DUF2233 family)